MRVRTSLTPEPPATCPGGRTERALLDVCPPHTVRCVPDHGGACGVVTESRAASHSAPLTGERGSRGSDPEAAKAAGPAALPHHAGAGKQLCRAGGRRLHRAVRWMLQSWGGGGGGLCRPSPPSFSLPPPGVPRAQQPGALPQRLPQRAVVGIRYGPAPWWRHRTLWHCWSCSGALLCASPGLCTCQSCCGGEDGGGEPGPRATAPRPAAARGSVGFSRTPPRSLHPNSGESERGAAPEAAD